MRLNGPGLWEQSSSPTCPPSLSGCIHVLEIKSQLSNDTAELNVLTFQVQSTLCLCHYDIRCNTHIEYDTHTQEHNEHTRSVLYHLFNRMTGVKWECVCVCVRVCAAYECSLNLMEGDASRCSCTRVQPLNTHTHTHSLGSRWWQCWSCWLAVKNLLVFVIDYWLSAFLFVAFGSVSALASCVTEGGWWDSTQWATEIKVRIWKSCIYKLTVVKRRKWQGGNVFTFVEDKQMFCRTLSPSTQQKVTGTLRSYHCSGIQSTTCQLTLPALSVFHTQYSLFSIVYTAPFINIHLPELFHIF